MSRFESAEFVRKVLDDWLEDHPVLMSAEVQASLYTAEQFAGIVDEQLSAMLMRDVQRRAVIRAMFDAVGSGEEGRRRAEQAAGVFEVVRQRPEVFDESVGARWRYENRAWREVGSEESRLPWLCPHFAVDTPRRDV